MYIQHPSASSPSPSPSPLQWSLSRGGGSAAWAGSMWRQPDSHPTAVHCTGRYMYIHVHCICLHPLMYMSICTCTCALYIILQVEKSFKYGCRDAPCKKSCKQGYPLSNTIKDTSTIMRNPLPELCREGLRMIVLVSLIVLLRGYPCLHDFLHGASLHPYSFN